MQQVFVLNGERIEVTIKHMRVDAQVVDVTSVGDGWAEYVATGQKRLEFAGSTTDGREISGVFRIVSSPERGVLEIEPWLDALPFGKGE